MFNNNNNKIRVDYEYLNKNERNISIKYFNKLKTNYGTSVDCRFLNVLIIIDFIYKGKN